MLAHHQSPIVLISPQPPHVQRDPLGVSRDSAFTRRFFGKRRVKLLPFEQTDQVNDGHRDQSLPVPIGNFNVANRYVQRSQD
jgi:hypothetical protein